MFESHTVHQALYRISYQGLLVGYVQRMDYGAEVRFKARLLHKREARLGVSLGEYFSLEDATQAFQLFQDRLQNGEAIFDTTERKQRSVSRNRRYWS
ncbi:MAG: hypothetical protein WBA28_06105 [Microbacteriaceae bacterium]